MNTRHHGQIVTKKKYIYECICEVDDILQKQILQCIKFNTLNEYNVKSIAETLWWINKLVYKSKDNQIKKLNEDKYRTCLFESSIPEISWLKNEKEINDIKKYYRLVDFLIHMLAVENEVYLVDEFEYVIHYVLNHKRLVDKPIYESRESLFPDNLDDFNIGYNKENN